MAEKVMRKFGFLFGVLALCAASGYGQTWGCPERDYKCQLDGRMQALKDDPKNPENYYNLGLAMQRGGSHKEAAESFSMYVMVPDIQDEYKADGYNNRAISYRALKQFDLARADLTKAIALNPKKKAQFLLNRGNIAADQGNNADAIADYSAAITVDPTYALAYANRGSQNQKDGKLDQALPDLAKAIQLDPSNAEPYYTRSLIYREKKEYKLVIADMDHYIASSPTREYLGDAYFSRGVAYDLSGSPEAALRDLTKAIETVPTLANAYKSRAFVYRKLGKTDLAEADDAKAKALRP